MRFIYICIFVFFNFFYSQKLSFIQYEVTGDYSNTIGVSPINEFLIFDNYKSFYFNNELDVTIGVQDLQSDGVYLYFSLGSSFDLQLSKYNHQNANTYNEESGETEYGSRFETRFWNDMSNQYNVNYSVDGVIRQLMLSQVRLDRLFYLVFYFGHLLSFGFF
jgi:ABC-type sugar transport system permease subunit